MMRLFGTLCLLLRRITHNVDSNSESGEVRALERILGTSKTRLGLIK